MYREHYDLFIIYGFRPLSAAKIAMDAARKDVVGLICLATVKEILYASPAIAATTTAYLTRSRENRQLYANNARLPKRISYRHGHQYTAFSLGAEAASIDIAEEENPFILENEHTGIAAEWSAGWQSYKKATKHV